MPSVLRPRRYPRMIGLVNPFLTGRHFSVGIFCIMRTSGPFQAHVVCADVHKNTHRPTSVDLGRVASRWEAAFTDGFLVAVLVAGITA